MAVTDITHTYTPPLYNGYTEVCKFNTYRRTEMTQDTDATPKWGWGRRGWRDMGWDYSNL